MRAIPCTVWSTIGTDRDTPRYWKNHKQSVPFLPTVSPYRDPWPLLSWLAASLDTGITLQVSSSDGSLPLRPIFMRIYVPLPVRREHWWHRKGSRQTGGGVEGYVSMSLWLAFRSHPPVSERQHKDTVLTLGAKGGVPGWYTSNTLQGHGQSTHHIPTWALEVHSEFSKLISLQFP